MAADPWAPDAVCETHEWRSALGDTIRFVTLVEATERMMPPVTVHLINVPMTQGARFNGSRHEARLVTLPVAVPGAQAGRDDLRYWARALDPNNGPGTLTVVQGPWAGRQLRCLYETGLETMAELYPLVNVTTLGFRAAEPYWLDATEEESVATIGMTGYTWFPFAGSWAAQPLVLGSSDVFAVLTIANDGDVETWPVVTVQGPGQELTLTNQTTGAVLKLTGSIAAGSVATIDTRPGRKAVTIDGFNAFPRLTPDSSLWPLVRGTNRVSIGFATGDANSRVTFAWTRRWLAA